MYDVAVVQVSAKRAANEVRQLVSAEQQRANNDNDAALSEKGNVNNSAARIGTRVKLGADLQARDKDNTDSKLSQAFSPSTNQRAKFPDKSKKPVKQNGSTLEVKSKQSENQNGNVAEVNINCCIQS
ncbi:uncharacterized protein LOC118479188 [Aplysia californica]|uniref:Uncharacterized protein LOC118479188 n=1 Tax=Aplysia californica TaxID=6500 RepID=A0ABM1W511_APLCA|nr:uncharacterized protein LOC118479188 [Aplysia californica]